MSEGFNLGRKVGRADVTLGELKTCRVKLRDLEAQLARCREALRPFVQALETERGGEPEGAPEDDYLKVTVRMGDFFRACIALGTMDVEYLRSLPVIARPSEAFLAALAESDIPGGKGFYDSEGYWRAESDK